MNGLDWAGWPDAGIGFGIPVVFSIRLRIVRFSGAALTEGIEERVIDGVLVRVINVARTVTDCFKFRKKIGLEAPQVGWRAKRLSMDELWRYATLCRVTNVIRPYMESLT